MNLIYDLYVNSSLNVDLKASKPSKWHEIAHISVRDFPLRGLTEKLSPPRVFEFYA